MGGGTQKGGAPEKRYEQITHWTNKYRNGGGSSGGANLWGGREKVFWVVGKSEPKRAERGRNIMG